VELDEEDVRILAHAPSEGCVGCLTSVIIWPIRKIFRTVLLFLQAKHMADLASEVIHRGLLLEESFEHTWLPGEAQEVRDAMDRALEHVDTRLVERSVRGVFRDHTHELNRVIWEATDIARERSASDGVAALADAADADTMGVEADDLSTAMRLAIEAPGGVVPELLHWFRAEMGAPPELPQRVDGVIQPVEVLPPDPVSEEVDAPLLAVEDAVELDGEGKPRE
jgi:hypothetical protein